MSAQMAAPTPSALESAGSAANPSAAPMRPITMWTPSANSAPAITAPQWTRTQEPNELPVAASVPTAMQSPPGGRAPPGSKNVIRPGRAQPRGALQPQRPDRTDVRQPAERLEDLGRG